MLEAGDLTFGAQVRKDEEVEWGVGALEALGWERERVCVCA